MIRIAATLLRRVGMEHEEVCRAIGIRHEDLVDLEKGFPLEVWRDAWEVIERHTGDPCAGIHAAENLDWGSLDVMDYVIATSRTVREVFYRLMRFVPIMNSTLEWVLEPTGGGLWMERRPIGSLPALMNRHVAEFSLACVILRSAWATTTPWTPLEVEFRSPAPPDPDEYARIFGCKVRFHAERDAFFVSGDILDLPMKSFDTALDAVIDRQAARPQSARPGPDPLLSELKVAIRREFCGARPRIEQIAKAMGMSSRSLQRRLSALGTTYQTIVQAEIFALAKTYLRSTKSSVAEIAFALGYSEMNAFQRAFTRSAGLSPRAFRNQEPALAPPAAQPPD
jgi:AraC-like DNA-binding protein